MTNFDASAGGPSAVPQSRPLIRNRGDSWELFGIFLMNLVLTGLTLGIYRFWAKTRLRRYLWGNLDVHGDPLEYTGTGSELFLGFLVVFVVILLPVFGGIAAIDFLLIGRSETARTVLGGVQVLIVLFLIGVALFRARRYRLTRTHWRGISGGQTGSSVKYGLMNLAALAANVASLGLAWPATSVWLKRYEMAHTWIGNERPDFAPRLRALYPPYLAVWGVGLLVGLALVGAFTVLDMAMEANPGGEATPEQARQAAGLLFLSLGLLVPLGLGFTWYRGRLYRHFVSVTRFHGHTFASTITGLGYLWLVVSNMMLVGVTIGLALPFTYQRYLAFVQRHVALVGDGDFENLLQNTQDKPRRGEGLADAFDIGGI